MQTMRLPFVHFVGVAFIKGSLFRSLFSESQSQIQSRNSWYVNYCRDRQTLLRFLFSFAKRVRDRRQSRKRN